MIDSESKFGTLLVTCLKSLGGSKCQNDIKNYTEFDIEKSRFQRRPSTKHFLQLVARREVGG